MPGSLFTQTAVAVALSSTLNVGLAARQSESSSPQTTLSVRAAIAEALDRSPDLRPAVDAVQLAQINERRASAIFAPKLTPAFGSTSDPNGWSRHSAGLSLTTRLRSGGDVSVSGDWSRYGTGAGQIRDAGYTIAIAQPLLRGLWITAEADVVNAKRAVGSAARDLTRHAERLIMSVAATYLDIVRQSQALEASRRSRDRAIRLRTMSDARAKIGLATQLDVLRADILAAQAEASVHLASESLDTARDRLNELLGRPLGDPVTPGADAVSEADVLTRFMCAEDEPESCLSLDALVARALSTRVDMLEARDRIGDARRSVAVSEWNLMPPVALNVSYTRRGVGQPRETFLSAWNGWRVGLSTSYTLDRSTETAAAAQAQIALGAAVRSADDMARRISSEVRAAHRAWQRAKSHIEIQRQATGIAQKQLRLAELRFERGLDGNLDVIDAENNLLQAETSLVGAQIDRVLALLTVRFATGTLDPQEFRR